MPSNPPTWKQQKSAATVTKSAETAQARYSAVHDLIMRDDLTDGVAKFNCCPRHVEVTH